MAGIWSENARQNNRESLNIRPYLSTTFKVFSTKNFSILNISYIFEIFVTFIKRGKGWHKNFLSSFID